MIRERKHLAVYVCLAVVWLATVAWLVFEHERVGRLAEQALLNRARDISNTIAIVSRSGPPGFIRQSRLEGTLTELTRSSELVSVGLLNSAGEMVVSAGRPMNLNIGDLPRAGTQWGRDTVIVVNLVEFGTITDDEGTTRPRTIVIPSRDDDERTSESRPPFPIARDRGRPPGRTRDFNPDDGRDGERARPVEGLGAQRPADEERRDDDATTATRDDGGRRRRHRDRPGSIFGRPFWMTEAQYDELLNKRGLHGFVLVLSTAAMRAEVGRDFWLRMTLGGITLVAAGGLGVAWRNRERSTRLQVRLVRAHELNAHLQEMNIAAAGLAHETRNPLNIVRGLAQMVVQYQGLPEEIRGRSRQITEEVDRVTGRLNEFINYSKPPEPRPAPTDPQAIARDVERMLESDIADKQIAFEVSGPRLTVEADESLLRQVLFNLLLNAIQAVGGRGRVRVTLAAGPEGEARLSVEDNGPGVPEEIREEVFRPYFTTHSEGSGLGLAVVKQIVLAHRWEIEYVQNEMGGATFRIGGIKIL